MKKHIIGFTIFAFIVGSFVSIWALFGYFTQTIPNVPIVQTNNAPVVSIDKKRSCDKRQRNQFSYEVVDSYYFADQDMVVSTLKLKWNGYGAPPKDIYVHTKLSTADNESLPVDDGGVHLNDVFRGSNEINVPVRARLFTHKEDRKELSEKNIYAEFEFTDLTAEPDYSLSSKTFVAPKQVVFVHGKSSILSKK